MSIALMTLAWKSAYHSGKKMVLLALCDNANDQGECFPSIQMLAEKCSMSERSVFNHIADLEKDGAIQRNNRAGRSTVYQLDPCKFCTPEQPLTPATVAGEQSLTPANSAPPPLQPLHPTPATISPTPATVAPITIKEPSSNHKDKRELLSQLPPDLVADFLEIRKAKKLPLTKTSVDGLIRESSKAGLTLEDAVRYCCEVGWGSFNAGWFADRTKKQASTETAYARSMREKYEQIAPSVAAKNPSRIDPNTFFDSLPAKPLEIANG